MSLDLPLKQAFRSARWRFAAIALGLAVLATFLLGGFRPAPPRRVPQAEAGVRVVSGALAVRALGAWVDDEDPRGYPDRGGQDFLVLDAVVENLTGSSSNVYLPQDLRWLADPSDREGRPPDRILLADDLTLHDYLHPAMPTRVLMVWRIARGRAGERALRFGLYKRRFLEKAYVSNESGWLQDGPGTTLKLAVEDRRGTEAR